MPKNKGQEMGKQKLISNIIISGLINTFIFYVVVSLYDFYFNNEPLISASRVLVSVFAVTCMYFMSNDYFSIFNKIRSMKHERTDK